MLDFYVEEFIGSETSSIRHFTIKHVSANTHLGCVAGRERSWSREGTVKTTVKSKKYTNK